MPDKQRLKLSSDSHTHIPICTHTHTQREKKVKEETGRRKKSFTAMGDSSPKPELQSELPVHPSQSLDSHLQDYDFRGPECTALTGIPYDIKTISLSTLTTQPPPSLPSGSPDFYSVKLSWTQLCLFILHKRATQSPAPGYP